MESWKLKTLGASSNHQVFTGLPYCVIVTLTRGFSQHPAYSSLIARFYQCIDFKGISLAGADSRERLPSTPDLHKGNSDESQDVNKQSSRLGLGPIGWRQCIVQGGITCYIVPDRNHPALLWGLDNPPFLFHQPSGHSSIVYILRSHISDL